MTKIACLSTKESPEQGGFTGEFFQIFKELTLILHKLSKYRREGNMSKTRQTYKKRMLKANIAYDVDAEILSEVLANQV